MMAKTHVISGLLAGTVLIQSNTLIADNAILFLGAVAVGSLLPDIDHPHSVIAQFIPFIGAIISRVVSHRSFFHSVLGVGLIFFVILPPILPNVSLTYGVNDHFLTAKSIPLGYDAVIWLGLLVGYIVHIIGDVLTVRGVKLFYPAQWAMKIPLFVTGGLREFLLRWAMIVGLLLILANSFLHLHL